MKSVLLEGGYLGLLFLGVHAPPPATAPAATPPTPVSIANSGFEALYLGSNLPAQYAGDVPTGTFPTGPAPAGWSAYYEGGAPLPNTFIGVLNPGVAADFAPNPPFFEFGAPEGDNAVLLYTGGDTGGLEYGVEQTLGAVLEAGMDYRLSASVGNIGGGTALLPPYSTLGFFDLDGFPGYRLQLLAGGVVVAEDVDTVRPGRTSMGYGTDDVARERRACAARAVARRAPGEPQPARGPRRDRDRG